ncbi:hypothetical protein BKA22_002460 [Cellulomonas soli]|nr:hypothetical protein [Cellulomonas soli]NYI58229.1 hypothetical protein [Cellulomonas soli]NYI58729.1 hypothetical protein [Cellulomonas soli]NYI59291.1 hypothetical protein [Cellulomonas soli]NYI59715.1 hypothetical protein [Cellulomonas soli]
MFRFTPTSRAAAETFPSSTARAAKNNPFNSNDDTIPATP